MHLFVVISNLTCLYANLHMYLLVVNVAASLEMMCWVQSAKSYCFRNWKELAVKNNTVVTLAFGVLENTVFSLGWKLL